MGNLLVTINDDALIEGDRNFIDRDRHVLFRVIVKISVSVSHIVTSREVLGILSFLLV